MKIVLNSEKLEEYLHASTNDTSFLQPKNSSSFRVSNMEKLSGGKNALYSFSLEDIHTAHKYLPTLILKGYLDDFPLFRVKKVDVCIKEAEILKSLTLTNFPAPKVFVCEKSSEHFGFPFIIMEKLAGIPNVNISPELMAEFLLKIHNLNLDTLNIKEFNIPKDFSEYATNWAIRFRQVLNLDKDLSRISKFFKKATEWIEDNTENAKCSSYSLLHGDFHNGNILFNNDSCAEIIDWEKSEIGDPVFDVAYTYHMFMLMGDPSKTSFNEMYANRFVEHYMKISKKHTLESFEFYKVVTILSTAITIALRASTLMNSYKRLGIKGLKEYALIHSPIKNRWISRLSFYSRVLCYFEDYFKNKKRVNLI